MHTCEVPTVFLSSGSRNQALSSQFLNGKRDDEGFRSFNKYESEQSSTWRELFPFYNPSPQKQAKILSVGRQTTTQHP